MKVEDFFKEGKPLEEKLSKFIIPSNQSLKYTTRLNTALNMKNTASKHGKIFNVQKHEKKSLSKNVMK